MMELRQRRRAFVNRAYGLDRKASIANSYSGLRHYLVGGSEARFLYRYFAPNVAPTRSIRTFTVHYAL